MLAVPFKRSSRLLSESPLLQTLKLSHFNLETATTIALYRRRSPNCCHMFSVRRTVGRSGLSLRSCRPSPISSEGILLLRFLVTTLIPQMPEPSNRCRCAPTEVNNYLLTVDHIAAILDLKHKGVKINQLSARVNVKTEIGSSFHSESILSTKEAFWWSLVSSTVYAFTVFHCIQLTALSVLQQCGDQGVAWLSSQQRHDHIKCGWFHRKVHDNAQETMRGHLENRTRG